MHLTALPVDGFLLMVGEPDSRDLACELHCWKGVKEDREWELDMHRSFRGAAVPVIIVAALFFLSFR